MFEFSWIFFCLKILFNLNGKATTWAHPICLYFGINLTTLCSHNSEFSLDLSKKNVLTRRVQTTECPISPSHKSGENRSFLGVLSFGSPFLSTHSQKLHPIYPTAYPTWGTDAYSDKLISPLCISSSPSRNMLLYYSCFCFRQCQSPNSRMQPKLIVVERYIILKA
jgi:hypothetical protein